MKQVFLFLQFSLLLICNAQALSEFAAPFESVYTATCTNSSFKIFRKDLTPNFNEDLYNKLVDHKILKELRAHKKYKSKIQSLDHCETFKCKLITLFESEENLIKSFYLLEHYQVSVSPYKNKDADLLDNESLDIVLKALELIPPSLYPLWKNKRLVKHIKDNIGYLEDGVIFANASIELYSPWFQELNEAGKIYTLFHEIAHNLTYQYKLARQPEWLSLSEWKVVDGKNIVNKNKVVSRYAATNPFEDGAESIVAYRISPYILEMINKEKYEFIKNYIFYGYEFKNDSNCNNKSFTKRVTNSMRDSASKEDHITSIQKCETELSKALFHERNVIRFKKCYENNIKRKVLKKSSYPFFYKIKDLEMLKFELHISLDKESLNNKSLNYTKSLMNFFKSIVPPHHFYSCTSLIETVSSAVEENDIHDKFSFIWGVRDYCFKNQNELKSGNALRLINNYLLKSHKNLIRNI